MAGGSSFEDTNYLYEECCVICKQGFELENSTKVSEKKLLTLISYSEKCEKPDLHKYLNECLSTVPSFSTCEVS